MSLGIKQLMPDPWEGIETKYPVESKHSSKVRNFTNFGVFVELEEGIDGLIHISDLSWTKKVKHPAEFTKIGEAIEVVVLELDVDNRRLSLGHKQLSENPWDTYATIFAEGSIHEGEVSQVHDKGATVVFKTEGTEGYVPTRHMVKEDGSNVAKDEITDFKIIEFNKDSRRVVASATEIHKSINAEKEAGEKKQTAKVVKKIQTNVERSTLGDLDALSALKEKMEEDENK